MFDWRPNLYSRIHNIEVMLFELNAYLIRTLHDKEGVELELSDADKGFMEAAADFQQHLEKVLNEGTK